MRAMSSDSHFLAPPDWRSIGTAHRELNYHISRWGVAPPSRRSGPSHQRASLPTHPPPPPPPSAVPTAVPTSPSPPLPSPPSCQTAIALEIHRSENCHRSKTPSLVSTISSSLACPLHDTHPINALRCPHRATRPAIDCHVSTGCRELQRLIQQGHLFATPPTPSPMSRCLCSSRRQATAFCCLRKRHEHDVSQACYFIHTITCFVIDLLQLHDVCAKCIQQMMCPS